MNLSFSCLQIIFRPLIESAKGSRSYFLKDILLLSSYLLTVISSSKHSPSYAISHTPFHFLSHLFLSSSFLLFMSNSVIHLQVIDIKAGLGPNGEEIAFIFVVSPLLLCSSLFAHFMSCYLPPLSGYQDHPAPFPHSQMSPLWIFLLSQGALKS